jgi:hypothetical protein
MTASDYAINYPACLNVLQGLDQPKSKSSSTKYKKSDRPPVAAQNIRRASWNDASFSEIIQSSKDENKFENLFAAAAIANPNTTEADDDDDDDEIEIDSSTSRIEVSVRQNDKDAQITSRSQKSDKVYSWNEDSDLQDIKLNKTSDNPKAGALSSFISNLGIGYESASKDTFGSKKSSLLSKNRNETNSWVEESIVLSSPKVRLFP